MRERDGDGGGWGENSTSRSPSTATVPRFDRDRVRRSPTRSWSAASRIPIGYDHARGDRGEHGCGASDGGGEPDGDAGGSARPAGWVSPAMLDRPMACGSAKAQ